MGILDETDRAKIVQLQFDVRMPFTTVAERIGVSGTAVRKRVSRMRQEGILQIVSLVDPHLLDLKAAAIVGVVIQLPLLEDAAKRIAEFDEVSYLLMSSGVSDLLVEAMCRDTDDLSRLTMCRAF